MNIKTRNKNFQVIIQRKMYDIKDDIPIVWQTLNSRPWIMNSRPWIINSWPWIVLLIIINQNEVMSASKIIWWNIIQNLIKLISYNNLYFWTVRAELILILDTFDFTVPLSFDTSHTPFLLILTIHPIMILF